jgi:hypothetical protein
MSTTRGRKRLTLLLHLTKRLKLDLPCLLRPAASLRGDHPTSGNDAALGPDILATRFRCSSFIGLGR